MSKLQKINDIIVKPVKLPVVDINDIKGHELFPSLYHNILLLAKKKSGKTSTIREIINRTTDETTKIIVFSPTANSDPTWLVIQEEHENITIHDSLTEDGVQLLPIYIKKLSEVKEETQVGGGHWEYQSIDNTRKYVADPIKKEKKRPLVPQYLFIFDDMSGELINTNISVYLKLHRHLKASTLISTQYLKDLRPASLNQMDYCLMWPGIEQDVIDTAFIRFDLPQTEKQLNEMYKLATSEPYNFFYINIRNVEYRKNFNERFMLGTNK